MNCPCENQCREECEICSDSHFIDIIKDLQEQIVKLKFDNEFMRSQIVTIKTIAESKTEIKQ